MRRMTPAVLSLFVAAAASPFATAAVFPDHLMIQGRLEPRDIGGGRMTQAHLRVRLLDAAGVTLFEELHCDVPLSGHDGEIKLALGTVDPLANPLDLRFDAPWFVEIVACEEEACDGGVPSDAGLCGGDVLLHEPLDVVAYAWRAKYAGEADRARYADDCDRLDGLDSSDFMPAGADRWVDEAGDEMTGPLVLSGAPTEDLHAATKRYVDEQIRNAIPPGYAILGPTPVSPPGFHATGEQVRPWGNARHLPRAPFSGAASAVVAGGVLHAAAREGGDVWRFHPDSSSWSLTATRAILRPSLVEAGGKIHVLGALEHWIYDPATDSSRPAARHPLWDYLVLAASLDGTVYTLIPADSHPGGNPTTLARYDATSNSWVDLGTFAHANPGNVLVGFDGKLWALGGRSNARGGASPEGSRETWRYDPGRGTWSPGPVLNTNQEWWNGYNVGRATVFEGRLWLLSSGDDGGWFGGAGGGSEGGGARLDSIGAGETSWRQEPVEATAPRTAPALAGLDGELHVIAGWVPGAHEYQDPATDHEAIRIPRAWYLHVKD